MKKRIIMLCLVAVCLGLLSFASPSNDKIEFDVSDLYKEDLSGSGTAEDPFLVSTAENLVTISERVNSGNTQYASAYFLQTAEICLDGTSFVPIGTKEHPFTGSYDGGGYLIAYDDWTLTGSHGGVFGYANNAVFTDMIVDMNLMLDNPDGRVMAGMICAEYEGTVASNHPVMARCYATGSIRATSGKMGSYVGSFFGRVYIQRGSFTVADSMSLADISSESTVSYTGGLIGYLFCAGAAPASITRCYSDGDITATATFNAYAGGGIAYFQTEAWTFQSLNSALFAESEKHYTFDSCITACRFDIQAKSLREVGSIAGHFVYADAAGDDALYTRELYDIGSGLTDTTAGSLNGTVCTPDDVLSPDVLRGKLGFDLENVWIAVGGKTLRLVSHYAELAEYPTTETNSAFPRLVTVTPVNCTGACTLVFAGYDASGRLKTVHMRNAEPNSGAFVGFTENIERVEVFGMDETGIKPLFRKKLSCFARLSSTGESVEPA